MGAKITISKDIIPWLLQLAGDNAPEEILEEIRSWETGKNPTLNQINEISRKLHIPFGYFFLQSPCTQINPSPRFRSFGNQLNDDISKELKDTIYKMEDIQDWLIDYADDQDLKDCAIAGISSRKLSSGKMADAIREKTGLASDWSFISASTSDAYRQLATVLAGWRRTVTEGTYTSNDSDEARELFGKAGFEIDDFGPGTILVRTAPLILEGEGIADAVMEIAGYLVKSRRDLTTEKLDWLYHNVACRAAIKAGDRSSDEELIALAERLADHPEIRYCPHGRPVSIVMRRRDLEKQFGRLQ